MTKRFDDGIVINYNKKANNVNSYRAAHPFLGIKSLMKIKLLFVFVLLITCNNSKSGLHYPLCLPITNPNVIVNNFDSISHTFDSLLYSDSCEEIMACNKPNMMNFITASKHLRFDSGFVLDYIYDCSSNAAPIVYLRAVTDNPIDSLEVLKKRYSFKNNRCEDNWSPELIDSIIKLDKKQIPNAAKKYKARMTLFSESKTIKCRKQQRINYKNFFTKIEADLNSKLSCDGTAEGIYELAVFRFMYDRFALRWHSIVGRQYVIFSASDAKHKIERNRFFLRDEQTNKLIQSLDSIKFDSKVIFTKDTIEVRYFCFAPSKGIFSRVELMQNTVPYTRYAERDSIIISCGLAVLF